MKKYVISKHWDGNFSRYYYAAHEGILANLGILNLYNQVHGTLSFTEEECVSKIKQLKEKQHLKYKKISEFIEE